jgi:hypothetical protein
MNINKAQLRRDIEYLAGNLAHRVASTKSERAAAEYIRDRFLVYTRDVEMDDFYAIPSPWLLFALYYGEYFIIALLAMLSPWAAFIYGLAVFLMYLAEFTGFRVFAHLMAQHETQNVAARLLAPTPRRLFVVTAHYDSPRFSAITAPQAQPFLRPLHILVVACMFAVILSCAAEALSVFGDDGVRVDLILRWTAVAWLFCAAAVLLVCEWTGEYIRGASDNASGVAVLLALAERFTADPIKNADVWLVATGSKETWLSGMRRLLSLNRFDRATTYFLNIDHVGTGQVRYTTGEGMLRVFRCDREMIGIAEAEGHAAGAAPLVWSGLPSDALLPLARGYKAMGITTVGGNDTWEDESDRPGIIDYTTVTRAADFAENLLRRLAAM